MASRLFQFDYKYERDLVHIYAALTFDSSGDADLSDSKGVLSVDHDSAGQYTLHLKDNAYLFMHADFTYMNAGVPAAPIVVVEDEDVASSSDPTVTIQCYDLSTPSATDPGDGEIMLVHLVVRLAST